MGVLLIKVIFILSILIVSVQALDTLSMSTLDYCPLSCVPEEEGGKEGLMVDIMRSVAKKHNTFIAVDILPFNRYLMRVDDTLYDGVLVMGKEHAPQMVYPNKTAGGQGVVMLTKAASDWSYRGIESLKQVTVGTVKNFKYCDDELGPYLNDPEPGARVEPLDGANSTGKNIIKLLRDRVDVYVEGEFALRYTIFKMNNMDKLSIIDPKKCEYLNYTAFNPNKSQSKKWADIYSKELQVMYHSGELKKIMDAYGLKVSLK